MILVSLAIIFVVHVNKGFSSRNLLCLGAAEKTASFLEHFPDFPNVFLVGGPADIFVIELTDQVSILGWRVNVYCSDCKWVNE